MNKKTLLITLISFGLAACTAAPTATPTPAPPPTATPTVEAALPAGHPGLPLPTDRGELFSTSGACAVCHTNMTDEVDNDVSTDRLWRSSMMANASRDPYWQASVRAEVLSHPDYQALIEDKCTTCHTPMARFTAFAAGGEGKLLDDGFVQAENALHTLAIDGVSCTLCHQIEETGFGEEASFSGGYVIDTARPSGERLTYGPYEIEQSQVQVMQAASGFIPQQGLHIEHSEMCATCHTLHTPYLDAAGQVAGEFPEQTPYLEWLHSTYRDTQSCQACHMPPAQGAVRLSITGSPPRSPFFQHIFAGGNAYMLEILKTFGDELAVTASEEHFDQKIASVLDQLQNRTATVTLQDAGLSGSDLTATVIIESLVGHKFPSGFPARRTWLHLTVRDANDQTVFESGAFNPDGAIAGNDNDADPAAYEPHYLTIDAPDQVQIYEAIMQNTEGEVTTTLLRGASYIKDNRLLPAGFDKDTADDAVAVHGQAAQDADFLGGGDGVQYMVNVGDAPGPFTVTVELLYQSIAYRWAKNLQRYDSPESARFGRYYQTVSNKPVIVARATIKVGGEQ